MSGFANKLKDRLHGIASDLSIDTERFDGFEENPEQMMARVQRSPAGRHIEAMAPVVDVFGMLQIKRKDRAGRDVVTHRSSDSSTRRTGWISRLLRACAERGRSNSRIGSDDFCDRCD
jgi:hypothetical protein